MRSSSGNRWQHQPLGRLPSLDASLSRLEQAINGTSLDLDPVVNSMLELYKRKLEDQGQEIRSLQRALKEAKAQCHQLEGLGEELHNEKSRRSAASKEVAKLKAELGQIKEEMEAKDAQSLQAEHALRSLQRSLHAEEHELQEKGRVLEAVQRKVAAEQEWRRLVLKWMNAELSAAEVSVAIQP